MRGSLIAGLALVLVAAGLGRAADVESKIGCVDMERLLAAHPETKRAEAILEKQIKEFETEKETMLDKFKSMEKEVQQAREEADNRALSEAGRDKKRQEAEEKLIALKDYGAEAQQTTQLRQRQLTERRKRMRERIVDEIRGIVESYAADKGLALVVDSGPILDSPGAVVYSLKKMDITEDVLKLVAARSANREEASAGDREKTDAAPKAAPDETKKP
jgi:Skp family chaperone for outer membrane proteins